MKKVLYMMALAAVTLASCQKVTTEGMTFVTSYATLTIEGGLAVSTALGAPFTDPGYSALLEGQDVTDQVKVVSNVNTGQKGVYTVNYSIANKDGFSKSATRTVVVVDPNNAVEGLYLTDPTASFRKTSTAQATYGARFPVVVFDAGNGQYNIDDLYAGWYCDRAGYGAAYKMGGVIAVAGDTMTMISSDIVPWGDTASGFEGGKYDAATKTISYVLEYAEMFFNVTMIEQ